MTAPAILADLARVRAVFQLRAICAVIHGQPCTHQHPAHCDAEGSGGAKFQSIHIRSDI